MVKAHLRADHAASSPTMSAGLLLLLGCLLYASIPEPGHAQEAVSPGIQAVRGREIRLMPPMDSMLDAPPLYQSQRSRRPEWVAPLMSAVVPGAGQLYLGQNRFAGYMAVELYSWIRYSNHLSEGRRERDRYRALAADVARSAFNANPPLGDFTYYERMEQFVESGAFDLLDDEELQPETDESTYNGFIWRRARATFWDDPDEPPPVSSTAYQRALLYYAGRAIGEEYRWSWRNAQLEQDLFRTFIASSNEAFRSSILDLGVILGNHLLSFVDGYVSLRLRAVGNSRSGGVSLSGTLPLARLQNGVPRR